MNFFGDKILTVYPTVCSRPFADCLEHGFGLPEARGIYIADALLAHAQACVAEDGSIDFPRFIYGPNDLELESPAEVLAAGYMLARNMKGLRLSLYGMQSKSEQDAVAAFTNAMSGAPTFTFAPQTTGPWSFEAFSRKLMIETVSNTPAQLTTNSLYMHANFPITDIVGFSTLATNIVGVEAAYPDRYCVRLFIGKVFDPGQIALALGTAVMHQFAPADASSSQDNGSDE